MWGCRWRSVPRDLPASQLSPHCPLSQMDDDVDDDDDEDDGGESPLVGNFLNLCFSIFVPKFVPIFSKNIFLSQNLEVCMCVCACGGGTIA